MIKKYLLIFLIIISTNVIAASEQLTNKTITHITAYEDFLFISYTPSETVNQGCGEDNNGTRAVIDNDNDKSTEMISAALAAAAAGNTVTIGVKDCYGANDQYVKIYRIQVDYN